MRYTVQEDCDVVEGAWKNQGCMKCRSRETDDPRTGNRNRFLPNMNFFLKARWLPYASQSLTFTDYTLCSQTAFVYFARISAIISLYITTQLPFVTETQCVHCTVRTLSLKVTQINFRLQGPRLGSKGRHARIFPSPTRLSYSNK